MRAAQITRFGGPEVLDVVDLPHPTPGDGQQLFDVSTAGVNYADTHHAVSFCVVEEVRRLGRAGGCVRPLYAPLPASPPLTGTHTPRNGTEPLSPLPLVQPVAGSSAVDVAQVVARGVSTRVLRRRLPSREAGLRQSPEGAA